jgi:hypothetical protein
MPGMPDYALSEEEKLVSDELTKFWKEQMRRFFDTFPKDKPNPMIALRSAGQLLAFSISEVFKDFGNAREAGLNEVQFILRRITEWKKYTHQAA